MLVSIYLSCLDTTISISSNRHDADNNDNDYFYSHTWSDCLAHMNSDCNSDTDSNGDRDNNYNNITYNKSKDSPIVYMIVL
jgi:hypothetical protein